MKCLFPTCEKTETTRGLCGTHYPYAAYLVRTKKTTWEKLENEKKAVPKKTTGPKSTITDWFLSKTE
jgi:hypothetical protein